jgi:hypothetical protein
MFRLLALAAILEFIGDLSYSRTLICALLACGATALGYWLALPTELPFWPAFVVVGSAVVVGVVWDRHAAIRLGISGRQFWQHEARSQQPRPSARQKFHRQQASSCYELILKPVKNSWREDHSAATITLPG